MDLMDVTARDVVFIGDSISDVEVGKGAGVDVIGYANKFGKEFRLSRAGAVAIVGSMAELVP